MFESIEESRAALISILKVRKREHLIARIYMDVPKEVVAFLKPFNTVFDLLEFANEPTIQNVLPSYYLLRNSFQPAPNDSEVVSVLKRRFEEAIDAKWWTSISHLHIAAVYLDPSLRGFAMTTNDNDRHEFSLQAKQAIKLQACGFFEAPEIEPARNDDPAPPPGKHPKYTDPLAQFRSGVVTPMIPQADKTFDATFDDEIRIYESLTAPPPGFDLLAWWYTHRSQLPLLSSTARSFLVIPASSAEAERHFSALNAANIIVPKRSLLDPELVEALSVCLEYYKNL